MGHMDEEVLGVLKRCEICEEKTLHVDGVCQSHRIVRRKRTRPKAPPPAPPPPPPRSRLGFRIVTILIALALIGVFGAVHVLHGSSGYHVCWKDGWTFANTIVDLDEVKAKKPIPPKVLHAIEQCGY